MSDTRAVAYYCPYCGEEDLEPDGDEGGRWHCRGCTRTFAVRQVRPTPPNPPEPPIGRPAGAVAP